MLVAPDFGCDVVCNCYLCVAIWWVVLFVWFLVWFWIWFGTAYVFNVYVGCYLLVLFGCGYSLLLFGLRLVWFYCMVAQSLGLFVEILLCCVIAHVWLLAVIGFAVVVIMLGMAIVVVCCLVSCVLLCFAALVLWWLRLVNSVG